MSKIIGILLVLFLVLVLVNARVEAPAPQRVAEPTAPQRVAEPTAPQRVAAPEPKAAPPSLADLRPDAQKRLIDAVLRARETFKSASNDMARGASRPTRGREICAVLRPDSITRWVGTVYQLSTNSDGKGVLSIQVGPDVYVSTWNNSFSDLGDKTLIEPTSSLYQEAVRLSKRQEVRFDGRFFPSEVDCLREKSLTLRGSIMESDFLFRFSDIASLSR
jgi:hypothetical protein